MGLLVGLGTAWAAGEPQSKCPTAASSDAKRPNILFIFTDDQSHRTCGCYPEAYPWAKTPNINRLAEQGVRFSNAYIGTWCMPSRATMLTGLHPHGIESMRTQGGYPGSTYDSQRCPFWPSVFRRQGYFTAQIGKWHTGADAGFGRDWDYQVVWNRPGLPQNSSCYYGDQLLSTNGGGPTLMKGYPTDNYTRLAVEFIRGQCRDEKKPWYLWLCYAAPHAPYEPAERHLHEYPGATVPVPLDIYGPRPGKPDYVAEREAWTNGSHGQPVLKEKKPGSEDKTLHEWVRQYQQCVSALDDGVGRLLQALEETGQRENTLVVFTGDQGFAWGQHGFEHKLAPYDANLRSPLIFSMPGTLPAAAICQAPVGGVDLVPTFFRFANVDLPWEMHGHDLTPLLFQPNKTWPYPVLIHFTGDHFGSDTRVVPPRGGRFMGVPWYVMLRDGNYKYIRTLDGGETEELYDLTDDPEELTNLATNPECSERLRILSEKALAELRLTGVPGLPRPLNDTVPEPTSGAWWLRHAFAFAFAVACVLSLMIAAVVRWQPWRWRAS